MGARLRWEGLAEFKTELRDLPRALHADAGRIVERKANEAAAAVRDAYPMGPPGRKYKGTAITPGGLKRGVRVMRGSSGRFGQHYIVRSSAPHAHLFEYGTAMRETALGYNRGAMPGKLVFVPIIARKRIEMYQELADMVRDHGLRVSFNVAA